MKKTPLSEFVFWLHFPVVAIWFGLFAVPKSIWPGKVFFHFWFIVIIMLIQLVWGFFLTKSFDIICPLTTWMQSLRGYNIHKKKNYGHSYIAELLNKIHVKAHYKGVNYLLLLTLVIITVQYFWFG